MLDLAFDPDARSRKNMNRLKSIAVATLTIVVIALVVQPSVANAAPAAILTGKITHFTGRIGDGVPVIYIYSTSGKEVAAQSVLTKPVAGTISFRYPNVKPGTYRLGLAIGFDYGAWASGNFAPNNASMFYSTAGPTSSWSKASNVRFAGGRVTSVRFQASPGAHLKVRLLGSTGEGGPIISAFPIGAPTGTIHTFQAIVQKVSGTAITSTALLPGDYRIGAPMGDGWWYYTGSGVRATRVLSKAKVIHITKTTKSRDLGRFVAN